MIEINDVEHLRKLERNARELAAESSEAQVAAIHDKLADEIAAKRRVLEEDAARRETLRWRI